MKTKHIDFQEESDEEGGKKKAKRTKKAPGTGTPREKKPR